MSEVRYAGRQTAIAPDVPPRTPRPAPRREGSEPGLDETSAAAEPPKTTVQIELTDGPVGIRNFRRDDALALYGAVRESVSELTNWMVWCPRDYTLKDAVTFISGCDEKWKSGCQYCFAIFSVANGTLLGSVGLNQISRLHNYANVGYWVRSSCTQHGVATAAAGLAARFGIEKLALSRLELLVPVGNGSSRRVAEKIGARNEGVLRKRLLLQGRQHDALMYSLVAEDLRKMPLARGRSRQPQPEPPGISRIKSFPRSIPAALRSATGQ